VALLECYCRVDRWGRITIPMQYRQRVGDGATLILIPEERYIAGAPLKTVGHSINGEFGVKCTAGNIFKRRLDSRERITILAKLREHAEIKNIVVFLATDDYFELWSEKHWELEVEQARAEATGLIASQGLDIRRYESLLRLSRDSVNEANNTRRNDHNNK